jgi:hypothetical protein
MSHGVMFDVDITAVDPITTSTDIASFVRWNYRFVEQNRAALFQAE